MLYKGVRERHVGVLSLESSGRLYRIASSRLKRKEVSSSVERERLEMLTRASGVRKRLGAHEVEPFR